MDDAHPTLFKVRVLGSGELRNYTKRHPPFRRVQLRVGQRLRVAGVDLEVKILKIEILGDIYFFNTAEGIFSEADIVALSEILDIEDLLRQENFSKLRAFMARKKATELLQIRTAHPFRGAIGCRVQLLPHQLWVLKRCLEEKQIRALLADEVGLGKTIEAGLVFSALHARAQLKRVLILVPPALKVQWLTESYRRFNVRFRLDHESLIEDGEHRDFVIASFDEFEKNTEAFDLLIVDEAHRLVHDPERQAALANLVAKSQHVLFLSATPRVHGQKEFKTLLQILSQTHNGDKLTPLIFQAKRSELGLKCFRQLEAHMVDDKEAWLEKFLAERLAMSPPEKVFLITSQAPDVLRLAERLRKKLGEHFALFHEGMDLIERDRQAAYFADPEGAPFLISSEIGGEGRNFQFCHHMVLLDLPADPLVVEQRIGRLDRLGQSQTVHVWCPVLESESTNFETLKDTYEVFSQPWSGSGLEDTQELLASREEDHTLEKLRLPFDAPAAAALVQEVDALSRVEIRSFLERLYDIFGVEVEDLDTHGNLHVSTSSLMFVEYFPGLGESGERSLTFDRAQALAREDMTFFSVDHPEFIESAEFLLNSGEGRLAVAFLPRQAVRDISLVALGTEQSQAQTKIWSATQSRALPYSEEFFTLTEVPKGWSSPPAFLQALVKAFADFRQRLTFELDAMLVVLPAPSALHNQKD